MRDMAASILPTADLLVVTSSVALLRTRSSSEAIFARSPRKCLGLAGNRLLLGQRPFECFQRRIETIKGIVQFLCINHVRP